MKLLYAIPFLTLAAATTYFSDKFEDGEAWSSRWIQSTHKDDYGVMDLSPGTFFADESNVGLRTTQDAKFFARSATFPEFTNADKDLVVQFSVKHDQKIDCGGGYVKVFPAGFDPKDMHGESEYNIMFGPDICGYSTKKVHVIFNYGGSNHLIKKEIKCKDDQLTHVYTLVVKPDNSYNVFIDGESAQEGSMESDWDLLAPKEIKDPEASKPEDWVDNAKMDNPEDVKPDGWDDIEEYVADPDAEVPEDWDTEMDGDWEPPMISNPEFKGEWVPEKIDNPDFKGPWIHPMVDNPEYSADDSLYKYESFGAIGLDLWQVKSGSVFDNFLISDDVDSSIEEAKSIISASHDKEQEMKDAADAEAKAAAEEAGEDEDEMDDYDEEEFDDDEFDDDDFDAGHFDDEL